MNPSPYDYLSALVRKRARADAAIVIVFGGQHGDGFSVHGDSDSMARLPETLERMAREIRAGLKGDT